MPFQFDMGDDSQAGVAWRGVAWRLHDGITFHSHSFDIEIENWKAASPRVNIMEIITHLRKHSKAAPKGRAPGSEGCVICKLSRRFPFPPPSPLSSPRPFLFCPSSTLLPLPSHIFHTRLFIFDISASPSSIICIRFVSSDCYREVASTSRMPPQPLPRVMSLLLLHPSRPLL